MAYEQTVSSDSVAQDQIKAFVDRILRLREEAQAIKDDIKEIYAEAKANGFDKTVLGNVVRYVEKTGEELAAEQERDALFDLYLAAYTGTPSRTHAHAREGNHTAPSPQVVQADQGSEGPWSLALAAGQIQEPGNGQAGEKPVSAGAQSTGNVDGSAGRSHSRSQLSTESTASVPVDTHSIAKINAGGEDVDAAADNAGGGDSLPAVASNVLVMPAPKPLRPWCQHLDDLTKCGGYGRVHCSSCQKLKDAGAVAVPIIGSIGQ